MRYQKLFVLEDSKFVLIKDNDGRSICFDSPEDFTKYSGIVLGNYWNINYEPDKNLYTLDKQHKTFEEMDSSLYESAIAMLPTLIERVQDKYYGKTEEELILMKREEKLEEILEQRQKRNNVWDFVYDNHQYVNDEQNLQGVKVQVLNKPLTDPIPTFPGLPMAGSWRTSDDQYVPYTNDTFMNGLCEEYFAMRSFNFGWYGVLCAQVAALETKEEIEAFDVTQGWHPATVVPY